MAIISISRGSESFGTQVAEKVAQRLGYRCLGREAVFRPEYLGGVPEQELQWALDQSPLFFERSAHSKDRYIATVRAALLNQLSQDNVVYHGFMGHYFLQEVEHALKVRILAEMDDRVSVTVAREGLDAREARRQLRLRDRDQQRWGRYLYGADPADPAWYDVVLHVGKMGSDGAAAIVCSLAGVDPFQSTEASRKKVRDLALVASVQAALSQFVLDIDVQDVTASNGVAHVVYRLVSGGRYSGVDSEHNLVALHRAVHERTHALPGLKRLRLVRQDA